MPLLVHHVVARGAERRAWRLLSYRLMSNHTHLLVEAPRGELRAGIRRLRRAHAILAPWERR